MQFHMHTVAGTFLLYLDSWEKSVNQREGLPRAEKNKLLSAETLLGMRVTGG